MNILKGVLNLERELKKNGKVKMAHRKVATNDKNASGNYAEGFVEDMIGNTFDIHGDSREEILDKLFLVRSESGREPDLLFAKIDDAIEVKMLTLEWGENGIKKWNSQLQLNTGTPKQILDKNCNITLACRAALVESRMSIRNLLYVQVGVIDKKVVRVFITEGKLFAAHPRCYEEILEAQREACSEWWRCKAVRKKYNLAETKTKEIALWTFPDNSKIRARQMTAVASFNKLFEGIDSSSKKAFELTCLLSTSTFNKYNTFIKSKSIVVQNRITEEFFRCRLIRI